MLKTNKGKTKMRGYVCDLLADYSVLTHKMITMLEEQVGREKAVAILDHTYESGKMTKEEVVAKVMDILAKGMKEEKVDE